jgi:NUDE protein, C-terminal conserved region
MMEEEIRIGEQERENLRIETQRLRDELSDLKVEAEILQDKLRKQSARALPSISTDITAPNSPSLGGSPDSAASSPMITTPPDTKSVSTTDTISDTPTPPSPPISEASGKAPKSAIKTPMNPPSRIRLPSGESSTTPKPTRYSSARPVRTTKAPTVPMTSTRATPSVNRNASNRGQGARGVPNSTSLTHIRSLTAQMQRLEQRVQSARSKLPAPVSTPPRASPQLKAAPSHSYVPPSVTIRSRKRTGGSTVSGTSSTTEDVSGSTKQAGRISTSGISRLSFGLTSERRGHENSESSRPSSRASTNGFARPERPLSRTDLARPASRTSMTGARTPLGHYSQSSLAESRRPRSSIGGNFGASHGHGHSQSVSQIDVDEYREFDFSTPSRRSTFSKQDLEGGSAIPVPSGIPRRQSGGIGMTPSTRRTSTGIAKEADRKADSSMKPPGRTRKLTDVGETY